MSKSVITHIFFIIFISFLYTAGLTQDFRVDRSIIIPTTNGAKGAAMGQAFTALADDGSALAWNPAGLAQLHHNMASLSGTVSFGAINLERRVENANDYSGKQGTVLSINHIGFVVPVPIEFKNRNLVGSFAIRNLSDFADEITWSERSGDLNTHTDHRYKREGGLFSLSGGLGINVLKSLYVGAALNFLSGKQDSSLLTIIEQAGDAAADSSRRITRNAYSGFHFELGIIWKPIRRIAIGSRVRLPYTLQFNNLRREIDQQGEQPLDTEISADIPACFRLGLALEPIRSLTLAVDYVQRPWNKIEVHHKERKAQNPFEHAHSLHLGAEWKTRLMSISIPWRIGYFRQPEQLYTLTPSAEPRDNQNRIKSQNITAGFGIHASNVLLDFSLHYKQLEYDSRTLPYGDAVYTILKNKLRINAQLQVFL